MIEWFFWSVGISAIISAAGLLTERVLRALRRPVRLIWVAALIASFVAPLYAVSRSQENAAAARIDRVISQARSIESPLPADPTRIPAVEPQLIPSGDVRRPDFVPAVTLLLLLILFTAMPLGMLYEHVRLRGDRRSWREDGVDDVRVLVSSAFGPAIVGIIRPRIVMPEWSLSLPADERSLLLAHEMEHIRVHDSRLLLGGMFLLMLTPWNLAAWWQLSRLRLAIELDCDARVLRKQPGTARYGRLLIDVTSRAVGARLAVTAFAERRSSLRSRLLFMTPTARDRSAPLAVASAVTAVALIGCAGMAPRPGAPAPIAFDNAPERTLDMGVGDSIVSMSSNLALSAASDLPRRFDVEVMASTYSQMGPPGPRCGQYLRDPRDNTRLQLNKTYTKSEVVNRADTSVLTQRAYGYYRVLDTPRYGIGNARDPEKRIRVGAAKARRSPLPAVRSAVSRRHSLRRVTIVHASSRRVSRQPPGCGPTPLSFARIVSR